MKIKISEHDEQANFIQETFYKYRNDETFIRELFFSVPNGAFLGGRSAAQFMKLEREGFRKGVSDVLYLQARGKYHYLALEMKTKGRRREKDGGLSLEQVGFNLAVSMAGGLSFVCYGADEASEAFDRYMSLEPGGV